MGGSYNGDKSKKLTDSFSQRNRIDFPSLEPLIPVIRHNLTPSTKLHILLDHLEEFILLVNTSNRPDFQHLSLG